MFATNEAAEGWEQLGRHAPGPTSECGRLLRTSPLRLDKRQHPLKGRVSQRQVGDKLLQQWQYEVTGAGGVWYCPDPAERTIWLTDASVGHPRATE